MSKSPRSQGRLFTGRRRLGRGGGLVDMVKEGCRVDQSCCWCCRAGKYRVLTAPLDPSPHPHPHPTPSALPTHHPAPFIHATVTGASSLQSITRHINSAQTRTAHSPTAAHRIVHRQDPSASSDRTIRRILRQPMGFIKIKNNPA